MTKRYYTLRFEYGDAFHSAGDCLMNADNALHIGQTEACELKLPNTSQYEDAMFAVIEPREDGAGWKLIRTSPFKEHEVKVNGTPIEYLHHLENGDRITFEGQHQELVFTIREDELYASKGIVTLGKKDNRSMVAWLSIISAAIFAFVLYYLYTRPMSDRMIESAMQSVFQIKVDSMKLIRCDGENTLVKRTAYLDNEVGTAFLATDGNKTFLVTARHCIEPWLNIPDNIQMDTSSTSDTPDFVKMALEATTRNIIAEYTGDSVKWKMVSYCSLRKPESSDAVLASVTSDCFIIDNSRDHIKEYGDFNHQYFWRSLKVRPRRTDMMLGDIAYLPDALGLFKNQKAVMSMATKEEMRKFCQTPNRSLRILGRTANITENRQIDPLKAEIKTHMTEDNFKDGYPNMVITHDGNLSKGYSGGPVLTRKGFFGWRVIGVVSVIDKSNSNWYYSVPISEIERMNNNN